MGSDPAGLEEYVHFPQVPLGAVTAGSQTSLTAARDCGNIKEEKEAVHPRGTGTCRGEVKLEWIPES